MRKNFLLRLYIFLIASFFSFTLQAQETEEKIHYPPLAIYTTQQDHDNMMQQLGITIGQSCIILQ
jgi:hypothetical protein